MKQFLAALLIVLASSAVAQTPQNKGNMQSEVNTNLPNNTTGLITPAALRQTLFDLIASYQQYSAVNAQSGTTYTVMSTDYGQLVTFNNSSAVAVTLPQGNSFTGFYPFNFYACDVGTANATITPQTSTIGGASSLTLGTGGCAQIVSDGTNYQIIKNSGGGGSGTPGGLTGQLQYNNTVFGGISGATSNGTAVTFANGGLLLAGSSSGSTTVNAAATASGTVTVPAATDTLVARTTTDTLQNKTINTANNTVQITGTTINNISGNGSSGTVATTSGSFTNGDCVSVNSGNLIDAGGPCTTGGGGGTVTAALTGEFGYYASVGTTPTISGNANFLNTNSTLRSTQPFDAASTAFGTEITNLTAGGGTLLNRLAKVVSNPSAATVLSTADTNGAIGIVIASAGTSSTALIARDGVASCGFDGATTAGDYVQISSTTGGLCHDGGATYPTNGQVLGRVLSTNASAGTYTMALGIFGSNVNTGVAQTWTATQTFNTGELALAGSSSGTTTLNPAATASGILTLPAAIDTVAVLGLTQTFTGNDLFTGTTTLSQTNFTGRLTVTLLSSTSSTVNISHTGNYFICLDPTSNAITASLPSNPLVGETYLIKDCTGQSATHNITVAPAAGNIDGSATYVINTNYQSAAFTYNGSQWSVN